MYPFPQSITPAVRNHVDAQTDFLNDMSKSLFQSFQQMCDLNIQLAQTLIEETALASKHMLSANHQGELLSGAAARAQPTTDKLRAYNQHIAKVTADAQVELARVTEKHVQNTARTARTLADEVARDATEQTERHLRAQQDTIRQYTDPFARVGNGAAAQPQWSSGDGGSSAQGGSGQPHTPPQQTQGAGQAQRASTTH